MARFFVAGSSLAGGTVFLTGADAEHAKVLRLRVGEKLIVCDGEKTDHHGVVRSVRKDGSVEVELDGEEPSPAEPSVQAIVLAGLPKQGERSDYVVQKCTECGASEIVFFISHRCIASPSEKALANKLTRWQRIAEEAAKQSGRGVIPPVSVVESFPEALDIAIKTELPILFYEKEPEKGRRLPLRQTLETAGELGSVALLTGPEGGFEEYEADMAEKIGFQVCGLGPRILRCETAPVAALTAVMYATGNL